MHMQVSPLLSHRGGPAMGGGRGSVKGVSLLTGDLVEKLCRRALPIQSNTTFCYLVTPISNKKKAPRWRKDLAFTWPYNICKVTTRQESSWIGS